ncbi:hypothetical protein Tco_0442724 [Tanacetum coccineum]
MDCMIRAKLEVNTARLKKLVLVAEVSTASRVNEARGAKDTLGILFWGVIDKRFGVITSWDFCYDLKSLLSNVEQFKPFNVPGLIIPLQPYLGVLQMYEVISPKGYDRLLWGDLITLFESSEEDEIWKGQQDYKLIRCRLFDSCEFHVLLMDTGVAIHMMVEKKYPLTQEMLSRMLNRRLKVDHESSMAFELIRFIKAQLEE